MTKERRKCNFTDICIYVGVEVDHLRDGLVLPCLLLHGDRPQGEEERTAQTRGRLP
jgi:hypothetical protein